MPTKGKGRSSRTSAQENESNWTDDLPVCKNTGVGVSTNQIYQPDGHRKEEHPFEEEYFLFCPSDNMYLYGVFDGHDGIEAAKFAHQRLSAELLLGQLTGKTSDEEIQEVLRQAFNAVEKSYLESLDGKVAERTSLLDEIPSNLNSYELYQKYPDTVENLEKLNQELSCGTSGVIALVTEGKLFVANVGDSRALLCKTGEDGVLRVQQLSVDHDLSNEDEVLRLESLGLEITENHNLGNQSNTRCLGNYLVKGGYKEIEGLASAREEPIIAEPEISVGIKLDQSCRFLLLMSDGLYRSYEEATGTRQVNKEIASMAAAEFKTQNTLTGVAQAVVDKVVRKHHDNFMMMSGCHGDKAQGRRDDITLLVRNFNQPLPLGTLNTLPPSLSTQNSRTADPSEDSTITDTSTEKTESYQSDRPIYAYVDFTEYYRNVEIARKAGNLPPILQYST